MPISKFTEKELEKLEAEIELKVYEGIQRTIGRQTGLPNLATELKKQFKLGNQKCSPLIWEYFEKSSDQVKGVFFTRSSLNSVLDKRIIDTYETVCNNLEPFMMGSRDDASQKEKQIYKYFKFNKELSVEAMRYFAEHFFSQRFFSFSTDVFAQWFSSLKLGAYSNPERVLNGSSSLNYPDLKPLTRASGGGEYKEYSPRLEALQEYLAIVYELRIRSQLVDLLIRGRGILGEDAKTFDLGQWSSFVNSVKNQLDKKFGSEKGAYLFKQLFGSDNPSAPNGLEDFNKLQKAILEKVSEAILADQLGKDWGKEDEKDPFHRDYAKEQEERERRERENRERKERERAENDWSNLDPKFRNNPNLQKQWTDKGFSKEETQDWINIGFKPNDSEFAEFLKKEKNLKPEEVLNTGNLEELKEEFKEYKAEPKPKPEERKRDPSPSRQAAQEEIKGNKENIPPPKHTEFNNSDLNDALNKLKEGLDQDGKENHPSPLPDLSLGPIGIMSEDKNKLPWLVVGVNLSKDIYKSVSSGGMERMPFWKVLDPANLAISHGSGDLITLLLELFAVESNFSNIFHNIFWIKNPDKKGFARLVKDDTLENEKLREQLLITGNRGNDPRADTVGWKSWFWDKKGKVSFGVPGVKQKSWRFTRWMRTGDKAYDLDNTNHFIGILKSKGLLGGFRSFNYGRVAGWGSAPKRSVIWITNQLNYSYSANKDWAGDDINTINPRNGYSQYLLFSNLSTEEIQKKYITNSTPALNCKNLAELAGKIVKEGKGTLVRLGPDALELIDSQSKEQKERSQNETSESIKANEKAVSDQNLADIGLSREEFEDLNTPFTDPAKIANLIKRISQSNQPEKVAELLNKLFDHCQPKTREKIFEQMVNDNPVFNQTEKDNLKTAWKDAKTTEAKKNVWETLTSHQAQREAFQKKTKEQKDNIFEEQVNNNPRYGPPKEDTQERRDRFKEYEQADNAKKEQMQEQESEQFTTGENANQWGNYFSDNANRTAGAGDESVGSTTDNNFDGQFSWQQSLENVYKLKDLINMAPREMKEGMQANQPYWQVVMYHPLTYIFVFMGVVMAILASVNRKK